MDPISMVLGIALFCFILLYIVFNLDKAHVYLKILTVIFIIIVVGLIPKSIIDQEDHCELVPVNSTTDLNTTTYGYDYVCMQNEKGTAALFFKSWSWYVKLIAGYMIIFLLWYLLNKYISKLPGEVRGWLKTRKGK